MEDHDLISLIENFISDGKEARSVFENDWKENEKFYLGAQYEADYLEDLPAWRASNVVNNIQPLVEQGIGLVNKMKVTHKVKRRAGGNLRMEKILTAIMDQINADQKLNILKSVCTRNAFLYGTGIFKVRWNEKDESKVIPIEYDSPSTMRMVVDPKARDIKDARYVIEQIEMPISTILEEFPDKVGEIYQSNDDLFKGAFDKEQISLLDDRIVTVNECWFKDSTLICEYEDVASENTDEALTKKLKSSKKKYPTGRYIRYVGDVILDDKPNKESRFPYFRVPYIQVGEIFWGLSFVSPLKSVQEQINHLDSMFFDHLRSSIYPMYTAPQGLIDLAEWISCPDALIEYKRGFTGNIEKVQQAQLPPDAYQYSGKKSDEIMKLSGLNETAFGGGATSARPNAVAMRQEAAQIKISSFMDNLNAMLSDVGSFTVELIQRYLDTDVTVSVGDPEGDFVDYFDLEDSAYLKKALENPNFQKGFESFDLKLNQTNDIFSQKVAELTNGEISEEEAKKLVRMQEVEEFKNSVKDGLYSYAVEMHPVQPSDEMQEFSKLIEYMKYGGQIDPTVPLSLINIPNRGSILRANKVKQMMAMQQPPMQQEQEGKQQVQPQQGAIQ